MVVWVTRNGDSSIDRTDERGDGATGLKCVTMTSKGLQNLKSDMSGSSSNALCIADTEIDVADIQAVGSQNAEMVERDEAARGLAGHNSDELQ
jgi:hypothetical protein